MSQSTISRKQAETKVAGNGTAVPAPATGVETLVAEKVPLTPEELSEHKRDARAGKLADLLGVYAQVRDGKLQFVKQEGTAADVKAIDGILCGESDVNDMYGLTVDVYMLGSHLLTRAGESRRLFVTYGVQHRSLDHSASRRKGIARAVNATQSAADPAMQAVRKYLPSEHGLAILCSLCGRLTQKTKDARYSEFALAVAGIVASIHCDVNGAIKPA